MTEYRYSVLIFALLIWPAIINAQPGTQFIYLGIDWKADNLDGTMFWGGVIFLVMFFIGMCIGDRLNKKDIKKHEA